MAERIAEKIAGAGADYWLDATDLPGGGDIRDESSRGVDDCQEVIILFSPSSKDSQWVGYEIGAADSKRRYLTPILNNVQYNEVTLIQGIKAIELNDFDQYLSELRKRVAKVGGEKGAAGKATVGKKRINRTKSGRKHK